MALKKNNPGCGCCVGQCREVVTQGTNCSEMPNKWSITATGFSNGTCSTCNDYNGTFDLIWNPDNLAFESAEQASCGTGSGAPRWSMEYAASAWNIYANDQSGTPIVSFDEDGTTWNCRATNGFDVASVSTECSTTQTSIDAVPCLQCSNCVAGTITGSVQVDISGAVNQSCTECDDVNGTYILDPGNALEFGCVAECLFGYSDPENRLCQSIFDGTYTASTSVAVCWTTTGIYVVVTQYYTRPFIGFTSHRETFTKTLTIPFDCGTSVSGFTNIADPNPPGLPCNLKNASITVTPL